MAAREYPSAPVPAVGAVVVREDGRVLLARRLNPPQQGRWSIPGGRIELGETVAQCVRREVREECGVECEPLEVFHSVDRIYEDENGRVRFHYVIVDVLARWVSGEAVAGTDASEVGWFDVQELTALDLTPGAEDVIRALLLRLPR
ncbi:MAG: NUDIX hydrolase [Chloroflexota bacterium]|nr:NUDIX hydrolase [Chloroflexota bacterium]